MASSNAHAGSPTLSHDLRFIAFTIGVPVLLVIVLSIVFWAIGSMLVDPSSTIIGDIANHGGVAPIVVSVAIVVTAFLCVPLFVYAVLRHMREP